MMAHQETERAAHSGQAGRTGQSNAPEGSARTHTLLVHASDQPGAVDRIVGLLRRRRAGIQNLTIGKSEQRDMVRISATIDDSEVEVEHLMEQLRKIVNVREIVNLSSQQAITRELALVKVNSSAAQIGEIIQAGHHFGAHVVDMTRETVTLEVTGSEERVEQLVQAMQPFGVREVARTGSVAMLRGTGDQ